MYHTKLQAIAEPDTISNKAEVIRVEKDQDL